ncbi:MAG TPA: AMP-binding protein [Planctomycetota bacterium]|nr:AMP-binding protein [Planctomycetota bacterium]
MLGWLYRGMERPIRARPRRLAGMLDYVPVWLVRGLARAKLVHMLRYVYRRSPAQRARWNQAGVGLSDIRSPDVLRHMPFTTPEQLAEHPEEYICVPTAELIHVLTTTGTKGVPKKIYFTSGDLERQINMMGSFLGRLPGVRRAMAIFNTDLPTWSAGSVARRGIEAAGIFGILSHSGRDPAEQIDLIREYEIDFLLTMPACLHRITCEAGTELSTLGVRYIQVAGQAWPETFRREIETAWGAKLLDCYGSMEFACAVASECVCQNGLHLAEPDFWVEIVDPDTNEVRPDGEDGEVVLTTLSRRGMPLVRYRTHDVAHLMPRPTRCECGLPVRKMSRVRGRLDDVVIVGGDANVYADEFDRAFLSLPGVTDYQVVIEKDGHRDMIHVRAEADGDRPQLREALVAALLGITYINIAHEKTKTLIVGKVEVVPSGRLSKGRSKTRRIVDKREMPTAVELLRSHRGGRG